MGENRFRAVAPVVLISLLAACSVSTPRNGATVTAGAGSTGSAVGADGAPFEPGDVAADGTVVTEAGGTAVGTGGASASGGAATRTATGVSSSAGATTASPIASAPGVTADTVTVSIIAGFSGPLAGMVTRAYDGFSTWLDDVNEAGGINGRKVVLKKVDHKETADGGVAACKEALSNGSFIAMVPEGVEATLTAIGCLDAAGMPTYYYAPTVDPKWTRAFSTATTSEMGGHQMASYVANFLEAKDKKVGVIYVNQASYKAMSDAFVPEAKRLGMKVADVEAVEPNQASFTSPLLRMQQAGVEVVIISATAEAIGIIRDAKSMGYDAQMTGWGFQFDFITAAGRNLFDGVTGLRGYTTTDTPAFDRYHTRRVARGRGRARADDLEGFTAYGYALTLGAVLQAAGPNPTRASVVSGSEGMGAFDNGIMAPFTWTKTDHVGTHATFPIVCCNSDYTWKGAGAARAQYI